MATSGNRDAAGSSKHRSNSNNEIWWKSPSYLQFDDEEEEHSAIFEEIFTHCPNPSTSQRLEMKHMFPVLNKIEDKEIKAWFDNRR